MFSKQLIYCNCCGKEIHAELPKVMGKEFKCCSMECFEEMKWREALSIMGKEYYTKPVGKTT